MGVPTRYPAKKPKYLLLENVAALVSQKFLPLFNKWQAELESYGYTNYAQVLNSKDYGVPQNRDRIFLVSIRDEHPKYHFPKPFPLDRKLKDVLETDVDEKYYLSDTIVKGFEAHRKRMEERGNGFGFKPTDGNVVASSVLTNAGSRHCDNYIIEKDPRQMEMFETESEPLNPYRGGVARTIKAQYGNSSAANFLSEGSYGATGVIEYANKRI